MSPGSWICMSSAVSNMQAPQMLEFSTGLESGFEIVGNLNILGIIPPFGGEVKVVWIGGCGGGLDGGEAKEEWIGGGGAGLDGGEAMGSHGSQTVEGAASDSV